MDTYKIDFNGIPSDLVNIPMNNLLVDSNTYSNNSYTWQPVIISLNQIYFQERVKDLFIFCIYKQEDVFKIGLFEINNNEQKLKTDNLTEIIETLKDNLSNEEFQEYERRIFKYF